MKEPDADSLFEFPCQFPIKVMGKTGQEFEEPAITRRASAKSNYTALTVTITATSRKQLDAIYMDLTASDLVIMAL